MKKPGILYVYAPLFVVLLALMSLPKNVSLRLQETAVLGTSSLFETLQGLKKPGKLTALAKQAEGEKQKLILENLLLKNEIEQLKHIVSNELLIDAEMREFFSQDLEIHLPHVKALRKECFGKILAKQLHSIAAQITYRPPGSWTNFFWINVGKEHNDLLGAQVISKNSPVVVGTTVVGVVEYVGQRESRVRLITDPSLTPSVRVIRSDDKGTYYLAKGELKGSFKTEWRQRTPQLKGTGFNYDYEDEEGPARDLRSGAYGNVFDKTKEMPIIQENDLLITTGMDGVFPKGLAVAKVTKVHLLKEGDYYYDIEATSALQDLNNLTTVFVLPAERDCKSLSNS